MKICVENSGQKNIRVPYCNTKSYEFVGGEFGVLPINNFMQLELILQQRVICIGLSAQLRLYTLLIGKNQVRLSH